MIMMTMTMVMILMAMIKVGMHKPMHVESQQLTAKVPFSFVDIDKLMLWSFW